MMNQRMSYLQESNVQLSIVHREHHHNLRCTCRALQSNWSTYIVEVAMLMKRLMDQVDLLNNPPLCFV